MIPKSPGYPNVIEGQSSENVEKRFPFSGSIDEIRKKILYGFSIIAHTGQLKNIKNKK